MSYLDGNNELIAFKDIRKWESEKKEVQVAALLSPSSSISLLSLSLSLGLY